RLHHRCGTPICSLRSKSDRDDISRSNRRSAALWIEDISFGRPAHAGCDHFSWDEQTRIAFPRQPYRVRNLFRETIYALSSGALPSGVAVIRISGPAVQNILRQMAVAVPAARSAALRELRTKSGILLDHALVLYFQAPASFTGEDVAELQVHGGKATVAAILQELSTFDDTRLAEAGEFSRRAFLNGKMDLTAAEALSDLISAETELQRRLAIANADGKQRDLYQGWRRSLLNARALIEAELDFADEADVPGSVSDQVWSSVQALHQDILNHIDGYRAGEI